MQNQNFDAQELAKFAGLAAHWWDPQGELKTLHQVNPLRLSFIKEKISLKGKKAIDIGCGGGILTESLAAEGAIATGIDMNKSLIEVAKLHLMESNLQVDYLVSSAEAMADQQPNTYDIVTCLEMLEHVPNPFAIIKACAKLAKPGGHLFFSTLNRHPKSYLFAVLGAEYFLKLLPKGTHDYSKFIRPSELTSWAREVGLAPQEIKGISYHPLTRQFSLSNDININYLLYAQKL